MTRFVVERIILVTLVHLLVQLCSTTPLDDYVNGPDSSYEYKIVNTTTNKEITQYHVNMTSQNMA